MLKMKRLPDDDWGLRGRATKGNKGDASIIVENRCVPFAIDSSSGTALLTNVTITANKATYGGGLAANPCVTLNNSIVAGNSALLFTNSGDIYGTVDPSSAYNLIGSGSGGLRNGDANNNIVGVSQIRLAPLGNYGGPTQTCPPKSGSPVISAGSDDLAVDPWGNPLTNDQRGFTRMDRDVDIGACQFSASDRNLK